MSEPAEAMTDNEALTEQLETLREIEAAILRPYSRIESVFLDLDDVARVIRNARQDAVATVVTNTLDKAVYVQEDDCLVAIVPPFQSVTLPLAGTGEIKVNVDSFPGQAHVATYIR